MRRGLSPAFTQVSRQRIVLRAPRSRVWKALTEADQFGERFGVKVAGSFHPGAQITGQVTRKGYEHIPFQLTIEQVEPERLFAWRWQGFRDPAPTGRRRARLRGPRR